MPPNAVKTILRTFISRKGNTISRASFVDKEYMPAVIHTIVALAILLVPGAIPVALVGGLWVNRRKVIARTKQFGTLTRNRVLGWFRR